MGDSLDYKSCGGPHSEVCPPAFCITHVSQATFLGIWACDELTRHCQHVCGDQGHYQTQMLPQLCCWSCPQTTQSLSLSVHTNLHNQNIHHSFWPWRLPGSLGFWDLLVRCIHAIACQKAHPSLDFSHPKSGEQKFDTMIEPSPLYTSSAFSVWWIQWVFWQSFA